MREGLTPSEIWRRHWGYSGVKGEQAGADTKLQRGRGGNECEHRKAARRREAGQRPENAHSWRKPQHQGLHRLLRHTGNPLVLVALLSIRVAAPCCPLQEWFRDRNRDRQSKPCPRTAIRRDGLKLQMEMWLLGSIGRGCNLRQGPLLQRVRYKNTGKPEEIHNQEEEWGTHFQIRAHKGSATNRCNNSPPSNSTSLEELFWQWSELSYTWSL